MLARAFAVAVMAGYVVPLVLYLPNVGGWDHDYATVAHAIGRWNLFGVGLVKQWNPLLCGGVSLAADPQAPVLSLPAVLAHLVGPVLALKAATVVFVLAGFWGARRLGRLWFGDDTTAVLFGALFVGNGFFFSHLAVGHVPQLTHLLLPGLLWGLHVGAEWIRDAARPRTTAARLAVAVLGLSMVQMFAMDGSPNYLLYALPWLLLYAVVLGWQQRSWLPPALVALSLGWALVCDAVYVLPMVAEQAALPTARQATAANPLSLLWHLVVPSWKSPIDEPWEAHEYALYVGPALIVLVLLYRRTVRRSVSGSLLQRLLWLSVPGFLLGLGTAQALGIDWLVSPFDLLRHLPGYGGVRTPSRFWFAIVPLVAAGGAVALHAALLRPTRRLARLAVLFVVVAFQVPYQAAWMIRAYHGSPWVEGLGLSLGASTLAGDADVRFVRGTKSRMLAHVRPDVGVLNCYWPGNLRGAASLKTGNNLLLAVRPATRLATENPGVTATPPESTDHLSFPAVTARFRGWNRIDIRAEPSSDAAEGPNDESPALVDVILNHNCHRHWHADAGQSTCSDTRHLTLRIGLDRLRTGQMVTLTFSDPWSVLGGWITGFALPATCLTLLLVGLRMRRRRRSDP